MNKFYFPVFGSGLGHVARIYDIAQAIQANDDVHLYSAFDEAFDFLSTKGENVKLCPSIDLKWNELGAFSSRDSIIRFPLLLLDFSKQVGYELNNISHFDPNVVIGDSRLSAVLAAKLKACHIITILNQFKILFPPRFRNSFGSRFFERIAGNILGLIWDLSDEVLMPDLPPPYTIGEANVAGLDVSNKVKFVGFITPNVNLSEQRLQYARRLLSLDRRPVVLMQISGPSATRKQLTQIALDSSDSLVREYNVVISMGEPSGSTIPRRLSNNAWIFDWCPIKDELFALSDAIVARSGHGTISQCINSGKPAVYVPISNHSEQIWNAEKCQKLGIGIELRSELSTAKKLAECVEACVHESRYMQGVENLRLISRQHNGLENTIRIIQSYL